MEGKWYYKFINPNRSIKYRERERERKNGRLNLGGRSSHPGELNGKEPTDVAGAIKTFFHRFGSFNWAEDNREKVFSNKLWLILLQYTHKLNLIF